MFGKSRALLLALALFPAAFVEAQAQGQAKLQAQGQAQPGAKAPAPQPEYHPSFGDLMTFAVQPRHIKLGLAGKAHNWTYAAYEASELRNAFARIGRTIPAYRGRAIPELFASSIEQDMTALEAAIKARDGARFDAAYKAVTADCNSCHKSLDHAFVVIREPTASPYADQNLFGSAADRGRP